MSWRDRLQSASFKDAKFYVLDSERSAGRNVVLQELLPELDEGDIDSQGVVYTEDFGQGLDEFTIEGYIISNKQNNFDYMPERDALIVALRSFGKGTLKHPYYGDIEVRHVGRASIKESTQEGGIARFSMHFVQHKDLPPPAKTIDANSGVDNTVDNSISRSSDSMMQNLILTGVHIQELATSIKDSLQQYISVIRSIRGTVSQFQAEATGYLSDFIVTIDDVIDSPFDVITTIQQAGQQILNVVGLGIETIIGGTIGLFSGERRGDVTELNGQDIPNDIGNSSIDNIIIASSFSFEDIAWIPEEQIINTKLMLAYNKIVLMGVIAKIAIRTNFDSQEVAEEYRDKIKSIMEETLLVIGDLVDHDIDDNQLYIAMDDLRNSFMFNFEIKISGIAKSVNYSIPADGISTLQLAYNKYYDLDRAQDIFKRNKNIIKHPGFCPGGEELKILNA